MIDSDRPNISKYDVLVGPGSSDFQAPEKEMHGNTNRTWRIIVSNMIGKEQCLKPPTISLKESKTENPRFFDVFQIKYVSKTFEKKHNKQSND